MSTPSMVLLHGVGLDRTMWDPAAALLGDRFEVTALDLPGHGALPPIEGSTTLADLADEVATQVPADSHLVGFSLGALIAQYIAATRPDLVLTLTSVSSVCRRTPQEREAVLGRLKTAESNFNASAAASLTRWFSGTNVSQDWVRRTEATLLANTPQSFLACYEVFATGDQDVSPLLEQISARALAITGEDDPGSTPEMSLRLADAIPDCTAVIVPGARHMLPVQCPQEFVDSLTAFIGDDDDV